MKPDLMYIDGGFDIEEIIEAKISGIEAMCPCIFDRPCVGEDCFEQISFAKFALKELLQKVIESPEVFPHVIVEDFTIKMAEHACKNTKVSYPFLVAYDAAQSILDTIDEYG